MSVVDGCALRCSCFGSLVDCDCGGGSYQQVQVGLRSQISPSSVVVLVPLPLAAACTTLHHSPSTSPSLRSTRGIAAGSHVAAVSLCSKCTQPPAPLPASPYFAHIRMDVHPCFQHSIIAKWAVAAKNNNLDDLGLTVSNSKVENERDVQSMILSLA